MSELPVVRSRPEARLSKTAKTWRVIVHCLRVALLFTILVVIRFANSTTEFLDQDLQSSPDAVLFAKSAFPNAEDIGPFEKSRGGNAVLEGDGSRLGYLLQTSPGSDHLIGYSGPTNCLVAVNLQNKIQAVQIISSGDTVDHVNVVKRNQGFLDSFKGFEFEPTDRWKEIDAVAGATLTSHAMIAAIAHRMSGSAPSLKFNPEPELENVSKLFAAAAGIKASSRKSIWDVYAKDGLRLGCVLTTTPAADNLSGYQGPTAALAGFDQAGKCIGVVIDQTYDNQPYASYLDDDYGFAEIYTGKTIGELAQLTPDQAGIEGVSGATMTSVCVAEGLALAATSIDRHSITTDSSTGGLTRHWTSFIADGVTILLVIVGLALSFTSLNQKRSVRFVYQLLVIVVLGFYSGHMISQALMAGWAMHSIAWRVAPGLAFLTFAALLVPIVSKQQTYCQHVCPLGALQQLSKNRLGWRFRIPRSWNQYRGAIPFVLLSLTVSVAISGSPFNLASIEAFDGFSFRAAGWATITILLVGLVLSLFSPMAYCRFGCPTGAMLNYIRFRADSHRLGLRDVCACLLLLIGLAVFRLG